MLMSEEDIKRFLPHREPFLFVDGVIEIGPGERILAFKRFGLENVKFRKFVLPGSELKLDVKVLKRRDRVWRIKGEAYVEGVKVAEAEILASLPYSGFRLFSHENAGG